MNKHCLVSLWTHSLQCSDVKARGIQFLPVFGTEFHSGLSPEAFLECLPLPSTSSSPGYIPALWAPVLPVQQHIAGSWSLSRWIVTNGSHVPALREKESVFLTIIFQCLAKGLACSWCSVNVIRQIEGSRKGEGNFLCDICLRNLLVLVHQWWSQLGCTGGNGVDLEDSEGV